MALNAKRLRKAYKNYVKRYKQKRGVMERHGSEMASGMMTYREYKMTRQAYVDAGVDININQTIVSDQQYEFSISQARSLKEAAKEMDLSFKEESLIKISGGRAVRNEDLTEINNRMKELADKYPTIYEDFTTGRGRAAWIKENIFWDVDSE